MPQKCNMVCGWPVRPIFQQAYSLLSTAHYSTSTCMRTLSWHALHLPATTTYKLQSHVSAAQQLEQRYKSATLLKRQHSQEHRRQTLGQQTPTEAAELDWSAAPVRAAHAAPSSVACTGVAPAELHCGATVLARLAQQGVLAGSPAQQAIEPICSARIRVNGNMPCVLCMRLDESGECRGLRWPSLMLASSAAQQARPVYGASIQVYGNMP